MLRVGSRPPAPPPQLPLSERSLALTPITGLHGAMADQQFREIEVERLILREPNEGRARATLETVPPDDPDTNVEVPVVRLTLLTPTGEPALVAEVDQAGVPTLHIGRPDRGTTATLTRGAIDFWRDGNIVLSARSTDDGGQVQLLSSSSVEHVVPNPSVEE